MTYHNYNIKHLTSFGINCIAKKLIEISSERDLELINSELLQKRITILGGGTNTIFANDKFSGTILRIMNRGIKIIEEKKDYIIIEASAGEEWNSLVEFCCKQNSYWGIENLIAVPGNVGAAIVQNIGAYGQEIKDTFIECLTFNPQTKEWKTYNNEDCKFDYRFSIFKYQKGVEIIWKIRLKLSKNTMINTSYAAIQNKITADNITIETPSQICEIVKEIRDSKLPDPKILGNAGSFFKNPIISPEHFSALKSQFPDISFFNDKNGVKIAAGWLIEKAGWKGRRVGKVGMHEKQSLVMVNYGKAKGEEVIDLSNKIIKSIKELFNIELEKEVHIIYE